MSAREHFERKGDLVAPTRRPRIFYLFGIVMAVHVGKSSWCTLTDLGELRTDYLSFGTVQTVGNFKAFQAVLGKLRVTIAKV